MKNVTLFFATIILMVLTSNIFAQGIPETINYQGILKDASGVVVPNGDYNLTFKLYDVESGGSSIWSETKLISVASGIVNTQLGSVTPIPQATFGSAAWLGITVAAGTELTPRIALTAVPYSIYSLNVPNGSVTATKIADNEVVKSLNGLTDNVNIAAGSNVVITPAGNTLTISSTGGGGGTVTQVNTGAGLTGGPINTTGTISIVNDGVTSAMIIDEPGLAEVRNSTTHSLAGITTMTSIATLTITIPAAGYIVLEGKSIGWLGGVTGQNELYMQIDDTEGGGLISTYWTKAGLGAYASTSNSFFPVSCQRTFSKNAGTYTFYLEAQSVSGNQAGATTNLYTTQLRAIFYPTVYGAVTSLKENASGIDESIPLEK